MSVRMISAVIITVILASTLVLVFRVQPRASEKGLLPATIQDEIPAMQGNLSLTTRELQLSGWSKTYGGTQSDLAKSMVQTEDGGFAIAGWTYSFGAGGTDFWLVKTDGNGNMEWNKTYGGTRDDVAHCVVQTNDGGFALAGYTDAFGAGATDFLLIRTDVSGIVPEFPSCMTLVLLVTLSLLFIVEKRKMSRALSKTSMRQRSN